MARVVIRVEKLKSRQNVAASLDHNHRQRDTLNADPDRQHLNEHTHTKAETLAALDARLPDRRRKDAVVCLEYVITAGKDWFEKAGNKGNEYLERAKDWLEKRHGKENIIGLTVHRDEAAPHLVAYVVPIDERGKLNAKAIVGNRDKLRQLQTDFARDVGAHVGLERGIEGSRAKHQTVKEYYAGLDKAIAGQTQANTLRESENRLLEAKNAVLEGQNREVERQNRLRQEENELKEKENARLREDIEYIPDSFPLPEPGFLEGKKDYGERIRQAVVQKLSPNMERYRARSNERDKAIAQLEHMKKYQSGTEHKLRQELDATRGKLAEEKEKHENLREYTRKLLANPEMYREHRQHAAAALVKEKSAPVRDRDYGYER